MSDAPEYPDMVRAYAEPSQGRTIKDIEKWADKAAETDLRFASRIRDVAKAFKDLHDLAKDIQKTLL